MTCAKEGLISQLIAAYQVKVAACSCAQDFLPANKSSMCGDGTGLLREVHAATASLIADCDLSETYVANPGEPEGCVGETYITALTRYINSLSCTDASTRCSVTMPEVSVMQGQFSGPTSGITPFGYTWAACNGLLPATAGARYPGENRSDSTSSTIMTTVPVAWFDEGRLFTPGMYTVNWVSGGYKMRIQRASSNAPGLTGGPYPMLTRYGMAASGYDRDARYAWNGEPMTFFRPVLVVWDKYGGNYFAGVDINPTEKPLGIGFKPFDIDAPEQSVVNAPTSAAMNNKFGPMPIYQHSGIPAFSPAAPHLLPMTRPFYAGVIVEMWAILVNDGMAGGTGNPWARANIVIEGKTDSGAAITPPVLSMTPCPNVCYPDPVINLQYSKTSGGYGQFTWSYGTNNAYCPYKHRILVRSATCEWCDQNDVSNPSDAVEDLDTGVIDITPIANAPDSMTIRTNAFLSGHYCARVDSHVHYLADTARLAHGINKWEYGANPQYEEDIIVEGDQICFDDDCDDPLPEILYTKITYDKGASEEIVPYDKYSIVNTVGQRCVTKYKLTSGGVNDPPSTWSYPYPTLSIQAKNVSRIVWKMETDVYVHKPSLGNLTPVGLRDFTHAATLLGNGWEWSGADIFARYHNSSFTYVDYPEVSSEFTEYSHLFNLGLAINNVKLSATVYNMCGQAEDSYSVLLTYNLDEGCDYTGEDGGTGPTGGDTPPGYYDAIYGTREQLYAGQGTLQRTIAYQQGGTDPTTPPSTIDLTSYLYSGGNAERWILLDENPSNPEGMVLVIASGAVVSWYMEDLPESWTGSAVRLVVLY